MAQRTTNIAIARPSWCLDSALAGTRVGASARSDPATNCEVLAVRARWL